MSDKTLDGAWHPDPGELHELETVGLSDRNMHVEEHLRKCAECQETLEQIRHVLLMQEAQKEFDQQFADLPGHGAFAVEKEAFLKPFNKRRRPLPRPDDPKWELSYDAHPAGEKIIRAAEQGLEKAAAVLAELESDPVRGYAMLYAAQFEAKRVPQDPLRSLGLARLLTAFSASIPYRENLGKAQPVSREQILGEASITESHALNCIGKHVEARQVAVTARRWFVAAQEDEYCMALCDYYEGSAASFANQFEDAVRLLKKAAFFFGLIDHTDWVGRAEGALGITFLHKGHRELALRHFDDALRMLHPEAEFESYSSVLFNRAGCLVRLDQLDEAKKAYARALVMVRRGGFKNRLYPIRAGLAEIELKKGALARALELFTNLSRDAKADGLDEYVLTAELHIGECLARLGRYEDMRKRLEVLQSIEIGESGIGPALLELFESLHEGAVSPELVAHVAEYADELSRGNVVPYRSFRASASR